MVFAQHRFANQTDIDQLFLDTNDKIETNKCSGTKEYGSANTFEQISMLDELFSTGLSINEMSPEKLYNEIWANASFDFVEDYPEFPGGVSGLSSFIQNNLIPCSLPEKWPIDLGTNEQVFDSLKTEINFGVVESEPTYVMAYFDISKLGKLSNFRIVQYFSLNLECDNEALRVVNLMPNWIPAKIKGIPVNSSYTMTIDFKTKSAY